jgi:hypothetical protein
MRILLGKRISALILVLSLFLDAFFVVPAGTALAAQEGDYTYTVSDGNSTITGYDGTGGAIVIPSTLGGYPVVAIEEAAFYECSSLTSVFIPESITFIGVGAFAECSNLTSVTIGSNVTSIGDYAFQGCNLTSVTIPDSVIFIGNWTFIYCASLTSVVIGSGVTSIGDGAFYNCSSLNSVGIPNGITSIGMYTFSYCTSLTSVTIPGSVTSIKPMAFSYCTSLTSVTIPDNVTYIGYSAFQGCTSLTSVTIPGSVTSMGTLVFFECSSLVNIDVDTSNPNFVSIDGVLCDKTITSLIQYPGGRVGPYTIPDNITTIKVMAFGDCTSLTSVIISDNVTTIEAEAFYRCTSLISLTIPEGMVSLGDRTFADCTSLISITFQGLFAPSVGMAWTYNTNPGIRGHAFAASNFPAPGGNFHGLIMGDVIPVAPIVPGAPTNLIATSGNAQVVLVWTAPANDGGSVITTYKVYRGTASGGETLLTTIGNVLTYTDAGLTNGQPYFYKVSAVNGVGEGSQSNEVSSTPNQPATVPSAPQNLVATGDDGQVHLTWDEPSIIGDGVLVYHLFRGGVLVWSGYDNHCTDTGLTNDQIYVYKVAANNTAGWGPNSTEVQSTPRGEIDDGDNTLLYVGIGAVAIVAVAVAAFLMMRRKK